MKVELRDPNTIMKLSRLGSFHQSKLSFLRSFLSEFKDWDYNRDLFNLDKDGYGEAIYSFKKKDRVYSLVCFANKIEDEERSDRVIATKWDAAFTLYDGVPSKDDIKRLKNEVPKQEIGRLTFKELTLSRANKSIRVFNHVVKNLSEGKQPDLDLLSKVGYLYRTTAVYGSGKFGLADRFRIKNREEINGPFRLEMMLVYLVRQFTFDQVNHVAHNINPKTAVKLDNQICKNLGIGNSTGLGMAPFLVKHPILINNWLMVKESALTRMLDKERLSDFQKSRVLELIGRAFYHLKEWSTDDKRQQNRINNLRNEWKKIKIEISNKLLSKSYPLNYLFNTTRNYSTECHELMVSLILEIGGKDIDDLEHCLESSKEISLKPDMKIFELTDFINEKYDWALKINFDLEEANSKFWYVSEEKLEPRLGNRFSENGSELEQPLDIAKKVQALNNDLKDFSRDLCIAEFLMKYPSHRYIVKRVQTNMWAPYSEIQSNLIGNNCLPIDMLRFKLSFFGASKFDPKSDKWTRVNLFQGAPLADELPLGKNDDWWLPSLSCN